MPSWARLTWRRIAPLGSAVSGSIVIILQRASRSSTAIVTFGPSRSGPADESVLGEAGRGSEVQVHVRAEAPLVERGADLLPELARRLDREQRDRAAVGQGPIGAHQSEAVAFAHARGEHAGQRGVVERRAPRPMASRPPRRGPPDRPAADSGRARGPAFPPDQGAWRPCRDDGTGADTAASLFARVPSGRGNPWGSRYF